MTDTKENIMGTLPIGKLLMKMSVPVILSMLVSTLYGVIDSIFVSRLGDNALTAMSLATPISSLIACITVGFSVGMNAELSKKLGEGDIDGANKAAGNGILVNWIVAGIFLIFGLFFVPMFYRLQTDNATIQQIGTDYTSIICIFSFDVANQVMFERMLVATGRSLGSMFSLLTGTIVNLILDPILIFGYFGAPEMGMKGAAIREKAYTVREDGKGVTKFHNQLKTRASYRTLPLIPYIGELLKEKKERNEYLSKLMKHEYCHDYDDYICTDNFGNLITPVYVTDHFASMIRKHRLKKLRFHDLRHSCASLLLANGVPMKAIQEWLGHSTFQVTADFYSHLEFNSKLSSADAIAQALGACNPDAEEASDKAESNTPTSNDKNA